MRYLPWAFLTCLLAVFSGDFLSLAHARPAIFPAFAVALAFKRPSLFSLGPSLVLLVLVWYGMRMPDERVQVLGFAVFCGMISLAAHFLPFKHTIEFPVYTAGACTGWLLFIVVWARMTGSPIPLPPVGIVLLSLLYTVCLAMAFFVVLPPPSRVKS